MSDVRHPALPVQVYRSVSTRFGIKMLCMLSSYHYHCDIICGNVVCVCVCVCVSQGKFIHLQYPNEFHLMFDD